MTDTKVSSSLSSSSFKFLITTDNHLGYQERDPRRGSDSFTTFEECLRAARIEHEVDIILLGGDLFHDNKPSLGCLARASSLLRTYVLGDRAIEFALLSDPKRNFPTHPVPLANFQDPNINVAIPIFMIHGNHDDPVGGTSSIDILSTNGLVNYFGQVSSLEDIVVEPILLQKGSTCIALYGIGNVRDERMHRCFRMKKIRFVHPKAETDRSWFKILLLHQNRGVRGGSGDKCGVLESMLAGYGFDLVIWGNEHEQQMVPQATEGYDIIQPGSTILTSLSAQECNPKQYGILEVRGRSYRLTPFTLRSVRPVVRRTVELWRENPSGRTLDAVEEFLRQVVDDMISEAEEQVSRIPEDVLAFHPNIKFPLMRLSVDFTDPDSTNFPQPNINRFGQQYMDVVVNPSDLLRPIKPKAPRSGRVASAGVDAAASVVPVVPQLSTSDIRTKVAEVFNANARDACSLLSEPEVSAAVYALVEKDERNAIDERVRELLNKSQKYVWKTLGKGETEDILKPDNIFNEVQRHKQDVNRLHAEAMQQQQLQPQAHPVHEKNGNDDSTIEHQGLHHSDKKKQRSSFTLLDEADFHGMAHTSIEPITASMKSGGNLASRTLRSNNNNNNNNDDDDDELPGSNLHNEHGTIDGLISSAVNQSATGTKRPRDEVNVEDDDDDGHTNGAHHNIGNNINSGVVVAGQRPAAARGRGRGRDVNTAPKAPKAPRGKRAVAAAPMPTLQLTRQPVPETIPQLPTGSKPNPPPSTSGALNILSKWSSQN